MQMYHHCSVKGTICRKGENAQDISNHTHSYPSMFLVERGNDERPMSGKLHQEVKNSCTLSALAVEDSRWGHVVSHMLRTAPSRYHQIVSVAGAPSTSLCQSKVGTAPR